MKEGVRSEGSELTVVFFRRCRNYGSARYTRGGAHPINRDRGGVRSEVSELKVLRDKGKLITQLEITKLTAAHFSLANSPLPTVNGL